MDNLILAEILLSDRYRSSKEEYSVFKGIPVEVGEMPKFKQWLKDNNYRVRYRGPRRITLAGRRECLKKDATSISVYVNSNAGWRPLK